MSQSTILVVEDDASLRGALCDTLELSGYKVTAVSNGQSALDKIANEPVGLLLSDLQMRPMDGHTLLKNAKSMMPDLPVVMMTAYGTVESAVNAMHHGASDYLLKPFEVDELIERVQRYVTNLGFDEEDMVAHAESSINLKSIARRVAQSEATVLINGESGTGKEVLARFLHNNSPRVNKPFVAINCAAIPENMLEATLFGYEKGSFTGASQAYAGKFEQANEGTLLLDEISEMEISLQAKLLRVLQEREVERLGGRKVIPLNVRILATTNRHLREEVEAGRFREDLFYRLSVFPLQISPLRERHDDIEPLSERLLAKHAKHARQAIPKMTKEARAKLLMHSWPGNIRELDNVLQRAIILQNGGVVRADDILFEAVSGSSPTSNPAKIIDNADHSVVTETDKPEIAQDLRSQEQCHILDVLHKNNGSRRLSAQELGISERTLRYKVARFREQGIDVP